MGTYFPPYMHLKMSSAICFNLGLSKILSCGNGLNDDDNDNGKAINPLSDDKF